MIKYLYFNEDGIFLDTISIIIFTKLSDTATFLKHSKLSKLRPLTERLFLLNSF
jgi:hypothetical protein